MHSIEPQSVCETDFATPLLLRDRRDTDKEIPFPTLLERRLFLSDESGESHESTVAMEDSTLFGVSTIESP